MCTLWSINLGLRRLAIKFAKRRVSMKCNRTSPRDKTCEQEEDELFFTFFQFLHTSRNFKSNQLYRGSEKKKT
jgi:hypothetical protein